MAINGVVMTSGSSPRRLSLSLPIKIDRAPAPHPSLPELSLSLLAFSSSRVPHRSRHRPWSSPDRLHRALSRARPLPLRPPSLLPARRVLPVHEQELKVEESRFVFCPSKFLKNILVFSAVQVYVKEVQRSFVLLPRSIHVIWNQSRQYYFEYGHYFYNLKNI
jgi:hypothetical protein